MTKTEICNLALARLGANRINDYNDDTESSAEAVQCRLHYGPTKNMLLMSHSWNFAATRTSLSASDDTPDFEWDYKYELPSDMVRLRNVYDSTGYSIEGNYLYTNDDEVDILYTRDTAVSEYTPLFIQVLKLQLAIEMFPMLAGAQGNTTYMQIQDELNRLMHHARMVNQQEQKDGIVTITWTGHRYV